MAHLGLEIPSEPIKDVDTHEIINIFYLVCRGRNYIGGMGVTPLPISVRDINDVLMAHPVITDRELLDSCIFALDDIYLNEQRKSQDKNNADE